MNQLNLYTDISTKPNCSPLCDHAQVCVKCQRVKCVRNMNHSQMDGITCLCGEREWRPLIEPPKDDRVSDKTPILVNDRARHVYALLRSMSIQLQVEVVKQVLTNKAVFDDVKRWMDMGEGAEDSKV